MKRKKNMKERNNKQKNNKNQAEVRERKIKSKTINKTRKRNVENMKGEERTRPGRN